MTTKILHIRTCPQCPHHNTEEDRTDGYELVFKWHCEKLKQVVRRYVAWNDSSDFIPEVCPLGGW